MAEQPTPTPKTEKPKTDPAPAVPETPQPQAMHGQYRWSAMKVPLNRDSADRMGLVVGVAAHEGKSKNGDVIDTEHLLQGTGSLHIQALQGQAYCFVDHKYEGLDETYEAEFGKDLVAQSKPAGMIIDCAAVKNADGKYELEFLAVTKPAMYEQIKAGKVTGNSVHDMPRARKCDGKECVSQTSSYVNNSFMLKSVASMDNTYVRAATDADLENINKASEGVKYETIPPVAEKIEKWNVPEPAPQMPMPPVPETASVPNSQETPKPENKLSAYRNAAGAWLNAEAPTKYLTEAKSLPLPVATAITEYMAKNPDAINMQQLEHYTADNFYQFYTSTQVQYMQQRMADLEAKLAQKPTSPLASVSAIDAPAAGTPDKNGMTPEVRNQLEHKRDIFAASAASIVIPPGTTRGAKRRLAGQKYQYEQRVKDITEFLNTH